MTRYDIPVGRENAITRADLADLWACDIREARRAVATFRTNPTDDPYAILSSSSHPAGYWRSSDPYEIAAYVKETKSRAANTLAALADAGRFIHV